MLDQLVGLRDVLQDNPWTATALAACGAVLLALVARAAARAVLLRASRGSPVLHRTIESTEPAGAMAIPLVALQLVWTAAPDHLAYIAGLRHFNALLLIGAATWLLTSIINGLADGIVATHPVTVEDNLAARRVQTQARVLSRSAVVVVLIAGTAMALMTFPGARQVGASLLASAGVLGIVAGLAARPVFSNLIAGLQLALAQPIRIDDVLIVEGEWGRVEEISGTYVVLRIWDERRLIVPLQWFIENPFQNWTRSSSQILGTVLLHLDFATPVEPLRTEAHRLVQAAPEWDRRVFAVQVTDTTERTLQLRILVSASDAGKAFDLRCRVREAMLAFIAREYPDSLPQVRVPSPRPAQDPLAVAARDSGATA